MAIQRTGRGTNSVVGLGPQASVFRWFRAVRFPSFTTSTAPIVVASALALFDRVFDPVRFVVMLVASMLVHAGCNLANDYYDHRRGVDTAESLGPSGVIQRGWLSAEQVRNGMVVCFALATALGLWVAIVSGPGIFWLALASLMAAFLYTGGPAPLAYLALGELTVFLAMGIGMVGGAYYVHSGDVSAPALLLGTAIGLLAAAILHANNVRDIEPDRARGKRTLANLLPRRAATIEYAALLAGAYGAALILVVVQPALWPVSLVGLSVPRAVWLARAMATSEERRNLMPPGPEGTGLRIRSPLNGAENTVALGEANDRVAEVTPALHLNRLLRLTAGLHLRFGLLATAGVLVATAVDRWV